jgi:hypothetical protein
VFLGGGAGIRTLGTLAGTLVFETGAAISEGLTPQEDTDSAQTVLPSCLPKAAENDPDLLAVIEAWPALPEHVRAAVLALVHTTPSLSKIRP